MTFTCLECGGEGNQAPHRVRSGKAKFCSYQCHGLFKSGHYQGENNPWFGHHHTEETKAGFAKTSSRPRETNPNWLGGVDRRTWQRFVLERDNFTCQTCQLRDVEIMEVDHILPIHKHPELKLDPQNMQCLCPNCHRRKTNQEKSKGGLSIKWKTKPNTI